MGVTRSNSGLFRAPGFIVSPSDLSMFFLFGLRSSYILEYHWLFALFLRSARSFTGVELTFMGLTESISGLFRAPGFIVSLVGKGERKKKRRREGRKKGIEKDGRKEERRNKKDQRKDKKKEF